MSIILKPKLYKYIRLPVELSHRNKVTEKMRDEWRSLRLRGIGWASIAKEYGVAKTTVMYNLKPAFRFRSQRYSSARSHDMWFNDPIGKKKKQEQTKASRKRILKEFPPAKRWQNKLHQAWRKRNGKA